MAFAGGRTNGRTAGRGRRQLLTRFPALALAALCLWVTIPFGSASLWARSVASLACFAVAGLIYMLALERPRASDARATWLIPACCLGAWVLFQTIPLPVRLLSLLQPLAGARYRLLFTEGAASSISFDVFATYVTLILWVSYLFLGWASSRFMRSRNSVRIFSFALVGIGVFQAIWGFVARNSEAWRDSQFNDGRLAGSFSSGNTLGGFLALTLPVTLGALVSVLPRFLQDAKGRSLEAVLSSKDQLNRFLAICLIILAFAVQEVALLLSGSRGGIISGSVCMFFLLVWFVLSTRKVAGGHTIRVFIVGAAIVCVMGIGGTYALTISRFEELAGGKVASAVARSEIWKGASSLFVSHPLGTGPGCFETAFPAFQPPGFRARRVYRAHNDYLQLLCELGFVGFIPLGVLMVHAFRRMRGLFRRAKGSYSVWLWRGAMLAVFAGLLHAFVDFNLTSRPGVAVTFVALLGIVLGYSPRTAEGGNDASPGQIMAVPETLSRRMGRPLHEIMRRVRGTGGGAVAEEDNVHSRRKRGSDRLRPFLPGVCVLSLACLSAGIWCWRTAVASRLMESGLVALGRTPDRYFRFLPAPVAEDKAVEMLERARNLVPGYGRTHYVLGTGRIREYKRTVERHVMDNVAQSPELRKEVIESMVKRATAHERIQAYAAAEADFGRASDLSPWSADIRAGLCRAVAESAAAATNAAQTDAICERVIGEARRAVMFAPNDFTVLRRVCIALTVCHMSVGENRASDTIREMVREWGHHAIRLGAHEDGPILRCWSRVGVPILDVMSTADTPALTLWNAYRQFNREGDAENCFRALDMLDRACMHPSGEIGGFDPESARQEIERFKHLAMGARARWMLRCGQWQDYRQYAEQRRRVFMYALDRRLREFKDDADAPVAHYLRLKSMEDGYGLDPARRLELAHAFMMRGETVAGAAIVAEACCMNSPGPANALIEFADAHRESMEQGYAWRMLQARILMFRGSQYSAHVILRELLEGNDLPFHLRHRARLISAQCLLACDNAREAAETLLKAAADCPTDRDVLVTMVDNSLGDLLFTMPDGTRRTAAELLQATTPQYGMGVRFLGGRVVLDGMDLQAAEEGGRHGDVALCVHLRFFGAAPDDLRLVTATRQPGEPAAYWNAYLFSKSDKLVFADGAPLFGCSVAAKFYLHRGARLGSELSLTLQAGRAHRALPSEEGIYHIEIRDWQKYVGRSDKDENQATAP